MSPVDTNYSSRSQNYPLFSVKVLRERTLNIYVQIKDTANAHTHLDTLNNIFDMRKEEVELIAQDTDDSNKQWYLMATPSAQPRIEGMLYTAQVRAGFGLWRSGTTHSGSISGTASGFSGTVSPNPDGNTATRPVLRFKPTAAKSGGWAHRWPIFVFNNRTVAIPDAFDITNGGWDSATEVSAGRAQADGDDVRVILDGVEVDRWFGTGANAMNQAATKVWVNFTLAPKIELPLAANINDSVTELTFTVVGSAKQALFRRLPKAGMGYVGTEAFTWTDLDAARFKITGLTRGAFGTTAASHTAGDTIKWLEHMIWLVHGDSTMTAPTTDDTRKPIFDLTSTNASHVYTSMADNGGKRTGSWAGSKTARGPNTRLYTGNQGTAGTDPATELGASIESYLIGSRYQDENATLIWQLAIPQGGTAVTATGEKYRNTTSWPPYKFQRSTDGINWTDVWSEATPASGTTWTAWSSHSAVALSPTAYFVRFIFQGAVKAGSGYLAQSELNDITVTLDSTSGTPTVTMNSRQSTYDLNATVTNSANGYFFTVHRQIQANQYLEIDCENILATYLYDNTVGPIIDYPDSQAFPMQFEPGVSNVLTVTETGLAGMTLEFDFQDYNL